MTRRTTAAQVECPTSLTVKLGSWFEARATGWGVAAIPLLLLLLALVGSAHALLTLR